MQWYFIENGAALERLDLAQIESMVAEGRFHRHSQICRVGESVWRFAHSDELLRELFLASVAPRASAIPLTPTTISLTPAIPSSALTTSSSVNLPTFSFGEAIALAFETYKRNWAMLLLVSIVWVVIMGAVGMVGEMSFLLARMSSNKQFAADIVGLGGTFRVVLPILVGAPLLAGSHICGAQAIEEKLRFSDLFVGFQRYMSTVRVAFNSNFLIVASMLIALLPGILCIVVANSMGKKVHGVTLALGIFFLLQGYVVAMAFVGVRLMFASAIACDPSRAPLGVNATLRAAWDGTRGLGFPLLGYLVVVWLIQMSSILLMGVGFVLVGLPFTFAATGAAYSMLYRRGAASASSVS